MDRPSNIQTKAYVVHQKGAPFVLEDILLDGVREDEVLVEIKYTGLCHTDLVVQQGGMPIGHYPAVLGHEGAGVVVQVGDKVADKSLSPGDTVLLSFHSCQKCRVCLEGRCGACPHMTETNFIKSARHDAAKSSPISLLDGTAVHGQFFGQSSLSKLAIVAGSSVVKVNAHPDELRHLPPLGCGYLTGAGTVFNALDIRPTDKVAIIGMGAVGLAALMAAKTLDVQHIVAVDIVDAKLQLSSKLGATHTINGNSCPTIDAAIKAIFPDGVDKIIDTTGVITILEGSVRALAHEGTLALVGVPPPAGTIQINALDLLTSCKRVIGVIEGFADPHKLIPRLVQLFHEGKFPIDSISKVYPADCLDEAIEDLKSGKVIKPILSWDAIKSA